ncbi:MAG: rRNA maturation RNase YbeY [Bdellovibrionales bacterium]|jgi:probable rRNA maturation factor|nr:rRNA maturation RNase YbeY [Bdellovibrionales bacterium]
MPKEKSLSLAVFNRSSIRVSRPFLSRWVKEVRRELLSEKLTKPARARLRGADELTLVFVSRNEIQNLNRTYRGKDKPTDVLSFDGIEEGSLGELVFSLAVIKKQAREHGLTDQVELGYMILHGILHLLGYDHEQQEREATRMFRLQDRVFDAVLTRW